MERVLLDDGRGAVDATTLDNGFTSGGACWWRAHDSGAVRVLVFADRSGPAGAARGLYGVEGDQGMLTDLNPSFDSLIAAVEAAIGWRARAADPTWDWAGPKEAGSSTDPYRRLLAYGVALHAEESAEAAALAESLRGPRGADGRFSGLLQLQAVEQQADWCRTPGAVNR